MAMSKVDVACLLGDWEYDGPLHVEVTARGVRDKAEGLSRIAEVLPKVNLGVDGGSLRAYGIEDRLVIELNAGDVQLSVILRAAPEFLADAKVETSPHEERPGGDS
jgi:hypothetical protein